MPHTTTCARVALPSRWVIECAGGLPAVPTPRVMSISAGSTRLMPSISSAMPITINASNTTACSRCLRVRRNASFLSVNTPLAATSLEQPRVGPVLVLLGVPPDLFNLYAHGLVFGKLALQETDGDTRFLLSSTRRKEVQIARLVLVALEVDGFYETFAHQGAQTEVELSETDTELAGELTLTQLWSRSHEPHQPVSYFVRQHQTAARTFL